MRAGLVFFFVHFCFAQYDQGPLPPGAEPKSTAPMRVALRAPPTPQWVEKTTRPNRNEATVPEGSGSPPRGDDLLTVMSAMRKEATKTGTACPSDTIFILDATSSVKSIFEEYIQFILKTINGFDISETDDRVGVIVYSSSKKQKEKIPLGAINNQATLAKAIGSLPFFSGITATGAALEFSATRAVQNRRADARLNLVVITDGYSYDDINQGVKKLHEVPNANIYAVAIGENFLRSVLDVIAGNPDRVLTGSTSYGSLVKQLKSCSATLDTFQRKPLSPETATIHSIPMMTDEKGRNLIPNPTMKDLDNIIAHDQVQPQDKDTLDSQKKFEKIEANNHQEGSGSAPCKADIAIVIDASGSLEKGFETQLKLATQIIEQLPIGYDTVRVALVKFAGKNKSRVFVNFSQGTNKDRLRDSLSRSLFISGTTYINEALELTADTFQKHGRSDVRRIVVLFSDGYSADNTSPGVTKLQSQRADIYTVGVPTENFAVNQNELQRIAGDVSRTFTAHTYTGLLSHLPTMVSC